MNADERRWKDVTQRIIGCVYAVANVLGVGFLEKVYVNALCVELELAGLRFERKKRLKVYYKDRLVGDYEADIVVEDGVILELKAMKALEDAHTAQCLNYLRATGIKICVLINFGTSSVQIKRLVHQF